MTKILWAARAFAPECFRSEEGATPRCIIF